MWEKGGIFYGLHRSIQGTHGEAFCLSENDVILECGVDIGGDVGRGAPAGAPVLDTAAVFLRVLALGVDRQPDQHRADDAHAQIQQMEAERQAGKGRRKRFDVLLRDLDVGQGWRTD